MRTNLKVVDNSGAKRVMCIQSLRGKKGARLGDTIIGSVKEAQPRGKVKKGDVVYGVVVRAAMKRGRNDGSEIQFDDNAIVLVNNKGELIGTRVFGPVPHELRKKKHLKILALAEHIVWDAYIPGNLPVSSAEWNEHGAVSRVFHRCFDQFCLQ